MKVPPKRKGNIAEACLQINHIVPSMKVPPKRKGNKSVRLDDVLINVALNESPSEKEGKFLL